MNIEDIIKGKGKTLFTVNKKTTAFDAVSVLDKERVGVLMVLDEKDNVAGILSERDVLYKCYNSGKKLEEQTVENLMTNVEDIIVGKLDDTPQQLMNIMTTQRIRHIPIIENENIVGIVSIGDLIKLVLENSEVESRKLREFIKNPFGIHIYTKE